MSSDLTVKVGLASVQLVRGDITAIAVDAIVNAANSALAGGGGVDGAIHHAGGPQIMEELDQIRARIGSCPTGSAVITNAGGLPAKYIIHAVGPVYRGGQSGEEQSLRSCYLESLQLAAEKLCSSISFPSISTGVYGYPPEKAAPVAMETVADWLRNNAGTLRTVKLVQFSERDHQVYRSAVEHWREQQQDR